MEQKRVSEDGSLQELRDMFQTLLAKQQARDHRVEQEAAFQEARLKSLQHQFDLLQQELRVRTGSGPTPMLANASQDMPHIPTMSQLSPSNTHQMPQSQPHNSPGLGQPPVEKVPHLQQLSELDDIEHYFTLFERIATACRWPTTEWAVKLVPLLTGKAKSAYVQMNIAESQNYEKVKAAIFNEYNVNPEGHRLKFRSSEVGRDETPKELYIRLKELYLKWVQPHNRTKEEIEEVIVLEQFLHMLSPDLQIWIKERRPKSASEAAALVDVFMSARGKNHVWTYSQWSKGAKNLKQGTLNLD